MLLVDPQLLDMPNDKIGLKLMDERLPKRVPKRRHSKPGSALGALQCPLSHQPDSRSSCALVQRACRSIHASISGKADLESCVFADDEARQATLVRFNISSDVQLTAASCCSRDRKADVAVLLNTESMSAQKRRHALGLDKAGVVRRQRIVGSRHTLMIGGKANL
ncbi:hypothetical protein [Cupriavidus sp. IDO]|uniref:hypothetical protein n=1 Tax=Cupriavidus sp. IDO TaxID=1539142 RepID=UPI000A3D985C|nr:hypothetical protein [Cupriavidus sp. IDO]